MPKVTQIILNQFAGSIFDWAKGQLHCHTNHSGDAEENGTDRDVLNAYKQAGFRFVAVTDHHSRDKDIACDPGVDGVFYLPGEELSVYKPKKSTILKLPLDPHTWIDIARGDQSLYKECQHTVAIGSTRSLDWLEALHGLRDQVATATRLGGLAIAAHPDQEQGTHYWSDEDLSAPGLWGMELPRGNVQPERWRALLAKGMRLWGICSDDSHKPAQMNAGWVQVAINSPTTDRTSIIAALRAGRFYSTSRLGDPSPDRHPHFRRIEVQSGSPSVVSGWVDGAEQVVIATDGRRDVRTGNGAGTRTVFTFEVPPQANYVQITASNGDAISHLQPLFIDYASGERPQRHESEPGVRCWCGKVHRPRPHGTDPV